MSTADALLILHLVGAFWMTGAAGLLTFTVLARANPSDVAARRRDARARRLSVLGGIVPGSVIVLVFGSWLVAELDHDFGAAWVSASYVLWLIFLGIATGLVSPRARREERSLAQSAASSEPAAVAMPQSDRVDLAAVVILDVLLVVFLVLMVTRPGA